MIRGAIFDLDGTLVYTLEDMRDALNYALAGHGFASVSLEQTRIMVGRGVKQLIKEATNDAPESVQVVILQSYMDRYDAHLTDKSHPYDGIAEVVNTLKSRGILMAVLSNKPHHQTMRLIETLFGGVMFMAVFGQREGIAHKPDPYASLEICRLMGLTPDEVMFVGDSEVDIKTGINAGMRTAGCLWGYRDESALVSQGASYLVHIPDRLLDLF